MCFSHNCRCGAQFLSKATIVRLGLHEAALSFPLCPLPSAEHTNIYPPGAQCREDSSPEFLPHSLTHSVDAFLISSTLLNTNYILPGCRDTVFGRGRGRVMFWIHRNSLCKGQRRRKETEGFQGTEGRGICQEYRTKSRREQARLWELRGGLWDQMERESGPDPLRAKTLGTTGCLPMPLT